MTQEMKKLERAFEIIAATFHDPFTYRDRNGVEQQGNRLGFVQDQVLAAIPQQLKWSIDFNEGNPKRLPAMRDAVKEALRADNGTERAAKDIARAVDIYKRTHTQVALEKEALEVAKQVYRKALGKDWQYRDFSKANRDVVDVSAAREEAKRLLGEDVNVAADFNSNS